MMKLKKIKEIIQEEIGRDGEFSSHLKVEIIREKWGTIVGNVLSQKSEPIYIKNNILFLKVENSTWLQQMQFYKKNIIEESNKVLNGRYIENIVFQAGKRIISRRKASEAGGEEEDISEKIENMILENDEIYNIKKTMKFVGDEKTRKIFYKMAVKNKKREKYLLANGYKRCSICGTLFSEPGDKCYLCISEQKEELFRKIYRELFKRPYITSAELKFSYSEADMNLIERIHEKLKSDLMRSIFNLNREKKEDEMRIYARKYVMLLSKIADEGIIEERTEFFIKQFHVKQ